MMKKVAITRANALENRAEWLAIRRRHVTATDWPKITGTSRWGTADDVLADKLEPEPETEFEVSLPLKVGSGLEPLIIERVQEIWGDGKYLPPAFVSRKRMGFTPDLARIDSPSGWLLAEIKVSVKDWEEEVPPDYLDQVRFQAAVLGINQIQVVHLKLASWAEGLKMMNRGSVPIERLFRYLVDVEEEERKSIEREAERWWSKHIGNPDRCA